MTSMWICRDGVEEGGRSCSSNPSMQFLHVAMAIFIWFSFKQGAFPRVPKIYAFLSDNRALKLRHIDMVNHPHDEYLWGRYFLARAQRVSRTWAPCLLQPTLLAVTNNQQLKLRLRGWLLEGQTQHRRVGAVAGQIHRGWRSWHLNVERLRWWSESWGEQPRGKELPKPDTDWSLQHFQQYRTFRLPALANASPKAMAWMKNGLYLWEAFRSFSLLKKRLETAWHLQHPSFKVPERCIFFFFSRPFSSNFHMKNSPKSLADSFNHLWDGYHRIPRPTPRPAVREPQEILELRDLGMPYSAAFRWYLPQSFRLVLHSEFGCFLKQFVIHFDHFCWFVNIFDVYADSWFDASLFLKAVMDLVHF